MHMDGLCKWSDNPATELDDSVAAGKFVLSDRNSGDGTSHPM